MGSSRSEIIVLLFSLVLLVSWANSSSCHENFLNCLSLRSNHSAPITKVVHTQQNPSYLDVFDFSVQNLRYSSRSPSTLKPQFIVTPLHVTHVQAAVICARKYDMHIRVRSGGHDFEGLSYKAEVPFIIVDLVELRSVTVDVEDESAWVEGGATIGEVYYSIAQKSTTLSFPAGLCPSVGVGGHISGGGSGPSTRKFGLASDNILDAHIVDSDGRLLNRDSMGEDLFWAIRGAGAGSFGIITAWKLKLVPVPPTVTVFAVARPLEGDGMKTLVKWQEVGDKLPEDLFLRVILESVNGSREGKADMIPTYQSLFFGNASELMPIMDEWFPELGVKPEDCLEMSWIESTLYYINATGHPLELLLDRTFLSFYFTSTADYVTEPIPAGALEGIRKLFAEEDVGAPTVFFYPYGGKMSEIAEEEYPFPHRAGNLFLIHYWVAWGGEGAEKETQRHVNWLRKIYNYMTPYVSKNPRRAYLNYRDLEVGRNENGNTSYEQASVWGIKYYGDNFDRLVRIKTKVDPSNFFWNEQSIPILSTQEKSRAEL